MKKIIFPSLSILLSSQALFAQLGDFQLEAYNKDSTNRTFETSVANPSLRGGPFKKFFIGKNYRKEWSQPVRVPVLNFQVDLGGIKPKEEGGGRQTHSLELEDAQDRKWVLRSVRKYPEGVVPAPLEGTIAEKIVADGISASHPYGVLAVGTIAKAAGVPYLPNTLVYIPDDPALGEFRDKYKNTLSLLELRSIMTAENKKQKSYNTYEIIGDLFASAKNDVDQTMVLKGRLLDNFIMDFDRHEDQWEWVKKDSIGKTFYYPVPKDRDQAFFRATGLIPRIARFIQPTLGQLQGLRAKVANIKTFNFVARDFDRSFLNELDEAAWNREIDNFLAATTDGVIEEAINRLPKELQPLKTADILKTLKLKRQYFKDDMMDYYRFLSKTVSISGTNEVERFTITKNNDGNTIVQVEQLDSAGNVSSTLYQRSFSPAVTKELRLYGLEGDDQFVLRGGNGIKIRLIGGPGNDSFVNEDGEGKALVYDVTYESNTLRGEGLKNKIDSDPLTNEYRRLGAQYPVTLPFLGVELTREGGLFLGPTLKITRPGFRKEPYASMHYLYATRAINSSSYHFRYNADFIGIGKKTDLLLRTDATLPTVRTYFFGYGNNTQYNKELGRFYYLASYKLVDASLQLRYAPSNWLQFTAGPSVQYLELEDDRNQNKFVRTIIPQDGDINELQNGLWYGGGEARMQVNLRNHPLLTTRGLQLNAYAKRLYRLDGSAESFDQVGGNLSLFTDVLWRRVIVLGTSFGADQNFGKFSFPQAQYLGFRQNLRGFRFQRFAGRARAYNNSEVRINLGIRNFYFFKGAFGLIGFHDIGRVWVNGESSNTWHRGYGGGLWVTPFNKLVVMGTVATSKEENNWLQASFGFQF